MGGKGSSGDAKPLLEQPYAARQLIVVVDDTTLEIEPRAKALASDKAVGPNKGTDVALNVAVGLMGALVPFPIGVLTPALIELAKRIAKLGHEGSPVLAIPRTEAAKLRFLPGHPRNDVLYVAHPAIPEVYYPMAAFHRLTFEHKFAEAIRLLMALGAKTIEVEHVAGWSAEFSAKIGAGIPPTHVEAEISAKSSNASKRRLLFQASLEGTDTPSLPANLVWFHHEPTWQQIAEGRVKYGLKDFVLSVSYEDDFGINAGLKMKATKVGLEIGGEFEDHESTIWRIVGKF